MRLWEFDRLGTIASKQFNINKDGLKFVSAILCFLWMKKEQLGLTRRSSQSGTGGTLRLRGGGGYRRASRH